MKTVYLVFEHQPLCDGVVRAAFSSSPKAWEYVRECELINIDPTVTYDVNPFIVDYFYDEKNKKTTPEHEGICPNCNEYIDDSYANVCMDCGEDL